MGLVTALQEQHRETGLSVEFVWFIRKVIFGLFVRHVRVLLDAGPNGAPVLTGKVCLLKTLVNDHRVGGRRQPARERTIQASAEDPDVAEIIYVSSDGGGR